MKQVLCLLVLVIIAGVCKCDRFDKYDPYRGSRHGYEDDYRFGEHGGFGGEFGGGRYSDRYGDRYNERRRKTCERASDDEYCREVPSEREQQESRYDYQDLTDFQLRLFQNSNDKPNYVISGLSPQMLFSYLNWGADGKTREELKNAKIPGAPRQIQRLVNRMVGDDDDGRQMKIATAIFHANNMKMNKDFTEKTRSDAKILAVNFKNSQKAADTIREWATENTNGALDLSGISFDPETKIALASTLFFNGKWIYSFTNKTTEKFHLPGGDIDVEMMNITRKYNHGKIEEFAEWATIPYKSKESMVIILPNKDSTIDETIAKLNSTGIHRICELAFKDWTSADLTLSIPKFKIVSSADLVEPMKKMGIKQIFSSNAELPFIAQDQNLQITSASQKASMEVTAEGTQVVTYTQVIGMALSIKRVPPKVTFKVDRPFMAMICDYDNNFPWVMAKITDPTKSGE